MVPKEEPVPNSAPKASKRHPNLTFFAAFPGFLKLFQIQLPGHSW